MPIDLERLRAAAMAQHRDHRGRLRPGHPFRGRLPRITPPDAIAVEYARAIRAITVGSLAFALEPLRRDLPRLVAEARRELGIRQDSVADEVARTFAQAAQALETARATRLAQVAQRSASEAARIQGGKLQNHLKARYGVAVPIPDHKTDALISHFVVENVALVKGLGNRTLDRIATRVSRGFVAGRSADDISAEIQKATGIAESHADLIARDQLSKLSTQVTASRMQEIGLNKFKWRTQRDPNVRESHAELEGKIFRFNDPPIVDGEPALPGEPINCRCWPEVV